MKKIIKYFTIFFASALFMMLLSTNKASAEATGVFDTSKNKIGLSVYTENNVLKLRVAVTYTRGFDMASAKYAVCDKSAGACDPKTIPATDWHGYVSGGVTEFSERQTGADADAHPVTQVFVTDVQGIDVGSVNRNANYVIYVKTYFCAVRVLDSDGFYKVGSGCQYWHNPKENWYSSIEFKVEDVRDTNISEIEDEELRSMMDKITDVVMTIVMPVLYTVIGIFLVVKGTILGFQIVKSADEPQVRQEKIGALKWLVIGVAIAYAATGIVHAVTGIISGAFNFS